MEVQREKIITNAEAKEILDKRAKEAELKYEQKNALDHLKKFVKTSPEKIKALVEELGRIEKLRERQIVAIANFLPQDKDDLRAILYKEYSTLSPEEVDKILEIIKKTL